MEAIATTARVVGEKSWNARLGVGSFLTIEFGKEIDIIVNSTTYQRGEWHLWLYGCVWRLEKNGRLLVGCEDSREDIEPHLVDYGDRRLRDFNISAFGDANLVFDKGLVLRVFIVSSTETENWMLYTPEHQVLVSGSGDEFYLENATYTAWINTES